MRVLSMQIDERPAVIGQGGQRNRPSIEIGT
jgi:hypothetical protein